MVAFKALLKNRWFAAALDGLQSCIIGIVLATGLFMVASNALGLETGLRPDAIATGFPRGRGIKSQGRATMANRLKYRAMLSASSSNVPS